MPDNDVLNRDTMPSDAGLTSGHTGRDFDVSIQDDFACHLILQSTWSSAGSARPDIQFLWFYPGAGTSSVLVS